MIYTCNFVPTKSLGSITIAERTNVTIVFLIDVITEPYTIRMIGRDTAF